MAKGFRSPKGAGQPGMMQQLQKLQEQLQVAQDQLAEETVTGTAGGEAVKVTMLQDLILTAMNNALEQSRQMAAERLGPLAGGLPF